jgi:alginate O-acetyltransferase complex protein AlgI
MSFISIDYACFLIIVIVLYWTLASHNIQNIFLLLVSYLFYGWITPWFCILLATSSIIDYFIGLAMQRYPMAKKKFLIVSLITNLGILSVFKYFNFFIENVHASLSSLGFHPNSWTLNIILPVGISFYTFQSLSYTIDVYRGNLEARKSIIDFMLFVSFFPQLVAGPIERATHLLPQIESNRKFNWNLVSYAIPFLVRGYFKKMVIADNVSIYADKVFMLAQPSLLLLLAGGLAFTIQIYTDFSAYTDIARGSAKLIGFDLMENFNLPYTAISPSDFWRRWHISFSSWIRDYLYVPLGGSKNKTIIGYALTLLTTMALSGLWHGASWHFVLWGMYYAALIFIYRKLGMGGNWFPVGAFKIFLAWLVMICLIIFGWILFRTPDLTWLVRAFKNSMGGLDQNNLIVSLRIIFSIAYYSFPLFAFLFIDKVVPDSKWIHATVYGCAFIAICIFFNNKGQDFIYFQF